MTPRLPMTLRLFMLLTLLTATACGGGSSQPINKLVEPVDVRTGWFDAGVENNMNKLLPTVTLTLKNVSSEPVANVQLNAVIRRAGETEEWGGAFLKAVGMEAIPPGGTSKPIVLRSNLGYTGVEPRAQMLKNSQFVDANVQVFAKHGGNQWTKLGEWQIAREMLTQ
jgi:hypothetical protein